MAIEEVDLPIKNGDFPVRYVNVYQRVPGSVFRLSRNFLIVEIMIGEDEGIVRIEYLTSSDCYTMDHETMITGHCN